MKSLLQRIRKAFKSEKGMFDLASVIFGVAVLGIVGAVGTVAVGGLLRFVYDTEAKGYVQSIQMGQENHRADKSRYGSFTEILNGSYLIGQNTARLDACVELHTVSGLPTYTVYAKSNYNVVWYATGSEQPAIYSSTGLMPDPAVCN